MTAELDGVDLRYVRIGSVELIRRLYVAIRDDNWTIVPVNATGLQVTESDDGFAIEFHASHQLGDLDFSWRGRISADATSSSITYSVDGVANTDFAFNRLDCVYCTLQPRARAVHSSRTLQAVPSRGSCRR